MQYMSDSVYFTDAWVVDLIHFPCLETETNYMYTYS